MVDCSNAYTTIKIGFSCALYSSSASRQGYMHDPGMGGHARRCDQKRRGQSVLPNGCLMRTTNGMDKESISRPVHCSPERCIIRTSFRVPSPPSGTKPGWVTKYWWRRRYRRNPGRRGTAQTSSPPPCHTKCVGERQARYSHGPF
jgi:hypothetical protein